jgi:hypothetical protein
MESCFPGLTSLESNHQIGVQAATAAGAVVNARATAAAVVAGHVVAEDMLPSLVAAGPCFCCGRSSSSGPGRLQYNKTGSAVEIILTDAPALLHSLLMQQWLQASSKRHSSLLLAIIPKQCCNSLQLHLKL